MKDTRHAAARSADLGFSLIELVIAVLLLGLLAIGALPLVVGSAQASANNRSLVTATTYANALLAGLRADFGNDRTDSSCNGPSGLIQTILDINETIRDYDADDPDEHPGHRVPPSGSGLSAELGGLRMPGEPGLPGVACTAGATGPVAVPVTVEVFPEGDRGRVLVSLSTQILVGAP